MDQPSDALLTIGTFSRRSRLSSKALRLYDEMDLLEPALIDPHNGYRYYREEQLELARLIGLLRRLEMPLAQIAEVVGLEGSAASKSIAAYWQGVEADLRMKRKLVRYLHNYLNSKGEDMFAVDTREVEAQSVISIEEKVLVDALPGFIENAMGELYDLVRESHATPGIPFVIYHGEVNKDSDGPVEVCVPYSGAVEARGAAGVRVEPAHKEAFTRITKGQVAFPGILEAYQAVERWIHGRPLKTAGSPREVYFADWDAVGINDPACDIAFPVIG